MRCSQWLYGIKHTHTRRRHSACGGFGVRYVHSIQDGPQRARACLGKAAHTHAFHVHLHLRIGCVFVGVCSGAINLRATVSLPASPKRSRHRRRRRCRYCTRFPRAIRFNRTGDAMLLTCSYTHARSAHVRHEHYLSTIYLAAAHARALEPLGARVKVCARALRVNFRYRVLAIEIPHCHAKCIILFARRNSTAAASAANCSGSSSSSNVSNSR